MDRLGQKILFGTSYLSVCKGKGFPVDMTKTDGLDYCKQKKSVATFPFTEVILSPCYSTAYFISVLFSAATLYVLIGAAPSLMGDVCVRVEYIADSPKRQD